MLRDDMTLACRQCGKQFVFTKAEQEFYELKGFNLPSRCQECRSIKRSQSPCLVCSQCGTELEKEETIYCTSCVTRVTQDAELKAKKRDKKASEEHTKLLIVESQKAEVEELLRRQELVIEELKQEVNGLNQDLEEAHQFHSDIGWLQPVLSGMTERLDTLEQAQNKTNDRMLQIVQKVYELKENITFIMEAMIM